MHEIKSYYLLLISLFCLILLLVMCFWFQLKWRRWWVDGCSCVRVHVCVWLKWIFFDFFCSSSIAMPSCTQKCKCIHYKMCWQMSIYASSNRENVLIYSTYNNLMLEHKISYAQKLIWETKTEGQSTRYHILQFISSEILNLSLDALYALYARLFWENGLE